MYLTEYNAEKERKLTEFLVRKRVAADMLRENLPLSLIGKITRLEEDAILSIAQKLGISLTP